MLYRAFKPEIIQGIILFHMDALFRLTFSVFLLSLFEAVMDDNKSQAYTFVGILSVLWYISQLLKELGLNKAIILAARIKSAMAMLLYAKVHKMTPFSLNSSHQEPRIINLVAADLAVLEQRAPILMQITVFPTLLIGVTIILFLRIGWPSLIGVTLLLLTVLLSIKLASLNSEVLFEVNRRKDRRVQITK